MGLQQDDAAQTIMYVHTTLNTLTITLLRYMQCKSNSLQDSLVIITRTKLHKQLVIDSYRDLT